MGNGNLPFGEKGKYRNMKEHDYAKKIISTTFIILAVVAAVTAAIDRNVFADVYNMISKPFMQLTSTVAEDSADGRTKEELVQENNELHSEINDLVSKVIDYDDIKKENEVLRKYYGIKDEHPDYEIAVANVIRRDPNDDFYGFTIDKGSRDSVQTGDPVITDGGLVGWVSEVSVTTSRVTTLLSPEAKVGAMDQKTRDSGIATGNAAFSDEGQLLLSVISADNKIAVGDIVITTGVGGVYPADIVVGRVTKLDYSEYDTTPYAVIKPYPDLRTISDVVVITSFEGQGIIEQSSDTDSDTNTDKKSDTNTDTNTAASSKTESNTSSR